MRKDTLEQFIAKAQEKHGVGRYNYSESAFDGLDINLSCGLCHRNFTIKRSKHLVIGGCNLCETSEYNTNRSLSHETWLVRFKEKHNDTYDYSKTVCNGHDTSIVIGCKTHGDVITTPAKHIRGSGCKACGIAQKGSNNKISTQEFIIRSQVYHGDKYDYSLVDLENTNKFIEEVPIICPRHDLFYQVAVDHSRGRGCPSCTNNGYRDNLRGTIYILSCGDITKVGITNGELSRRIKQINQSSEKTFVVVFSKTFEDGKIPRFAEKQLLKKLRLSYTSPTEKFDGYTECFYGVNTISLVDELLDICNFNLKET